MLQQEFFYFSLFIFFYSMGEFQQDEENEIEFLQSSQKLDFGYPKTKGQKSGRPFVKIAHGYFFKKSCNTVSTGCSLDHFSTIDTISSSLFLINSK